MVERSRHARSMMAAVLSGAMLLLALPASAANWSPTDCSVWDGTTSHDSLQQAATSAPPGARLTVTGKCVGPTFVDESRRVKGARGGGSATWCDKDGCHTSDPIDSGPPTLKSGSGEPTLVVDPDVPRLRVGARVVVRGGLVIDDVEAWRGVSAVPAAWATRPEAPRLWIPASKPTACKVVNIDTGVRYRKLRKAVWAATAGDRLAMQGTCRGSVIIDKELSVYGARRNAWARYDTGAPTIRSDGSRPAVIVTPDVSDLVLKRISIRGGLSVGETGPYRKYVTAD